MRAKPRRIGSRLAALVAASVWLAGCGRSAAPLPVPEDVFGFVPGTDRRLADFGQITSYFERLAEASPRVRHVPIGRTEEGREMFLSVISSEANLARLDRYRDIARQLADSRDLDDEAARALAREGRAIVWVDMGLHATEVAPAQASAEIALALAGDETEEMRRIRDNVIVVLVPVMNPDGLEIVTSWYRPHVGTPFETSPLPVLYEKYGGHDNNRDWFMQNLAETRVVSRQLYQEWFPQIVYNHHQSGRTSPRIWAPPMDDPVNPNMHPLVQRGISLLGVGLMQRLEQEGKVGAQGYSTYSNWWNGGMRSTPCFHNVVGILTETASASLATPVEVPPEELPTTLRSGERATEPSTWNPSPWRGGAWRLRDQMDYVVTATMAVLRMGADLREDWLFNRYQMARDQVAAGRRGGPYAFVIAPDQHDWPTAVTLAETLDLGAVEIHRATAAFEADGRPYPAGSLVILMAQPNRGFAKDLLEAQHHPDRRQGADGPPKPPYDMAGWTLSYQMDVRAERVDAPFEAALERVTDFRTLVGQDVPAGDGPFAIDRGANAGVTAAMRALAAGARVTMTRDAFVVEGPSAARAGEEAAGLGVLRSVAAGGAGRTLRPPRVGVYRSHVATADEGWARFVLERFEVPYVSLVDADIRAGGLGERVDVVVLPDQSPRAIREGHRPGDMPPEFVGGLGEEGIAALADFVESGGTLVAVDDAADFAIGALGLPVRNVLSGVPTTAFYCPGSLLRLAVDPDAALTAGMPAELAAFFVRSRAFAVDPPGRDRVRVLARYAAADVLMSGWINGPERVAGQAAVLDVASGQGRVVLLGFGPYFRGQPHGTFKFLLNPILESAVDGGGRW